MEDDRRSILPQLSHRLASLDAIREVGYGGEFSNFTGELVVPGKTLGNILADVQRLSKSIITVREERPDLWNFQVADPSNVILDLVRKIPLVCIELGVLSVDDATPVNVSWGRAGNVFYRTARGEMVNRRQVKVWPLATDESITLLTKERATQLEVSTPVPTCHVLFLTAEATRQPIPS